MRDTTSPDLKHIVKVAGSASGPDDTVRDRVFAKIDAMTGKRRARLNPFQLLQYTPALRTLIIVALILPLSVFFAFQAGIPVFIADYPFTLVSRTGVYGQNGTARVTGARLEEGDKIATKPDETCVINLSDSASLSVLPESSATLASHSRFSSTIEVALENGSLYLNRKKELGFGKQLVIDAGEYRFYPEGTRALFERNNDSIDAACFEGRVKVAKLDGTTLAGILTLSMDEKIRFRVRGLKNPKASAFTVESPSEAEMKADEALRVNPESIERVITSATENTNIADDESAVVLKKETPPTESIEKQRVTEKTEKPYAKVTEIGRLGQAADGSNVRLFFPAVSGADLFVLTQDRFFRVRNDRIDEPIRFQDTPSFTSKPVQYANLLILTETHRIHIVDTKTLKVLKTTALGATEAIEDNYFPRVWGHVLYVPVKNRGYCTIDLADASFTLKDLYKEAFPLSPLPSKDGNRIVIGSFYENYIAALTGGKERWKLRLSGKSFSNVAALNGRLYTYIYEADTPKIIEVTEDGVRGREWKLDGQVTSDITAYDSRIIGVYTDGTLFVLDTASSSISKPVRSFSTSLSTRSLRYISVLPTGGKIYIGSEKGEIVIFDMSANTIEQTVAIKKGETFYTEPVLLNDALYAVSNSGMLYKAARN